MGRREAIPARIRLEQYARDDNAVIKSRSGFDYLSSNASAEAIQGMSASVHQLGFNLPCRQCIF